MIKQKVKQRWLAWVGWLTAYVIIFVIYYYFYYLPLIEGRHIFSGGF